MAFGDEFKVTTQNNPTPGTAVIISNSQNTSANINQENPIMNFIKGAGNTIIGPAQNAADVAQKWGQGIESMVGNKKAVPYTPTKDQFMRDIAEFSGGVGGTAMNTAALLGGGPLGLAGMAAAGGTLKATGLDAKISKLSDWLQNAGNLQNYTKPSTSEYAEKVKQMPGFIMSMAPTLAGFLFPAKFAEGTPLKVSEGVPINPTETLQKGFDNMSSGAKEAIDTGVTRGNDMINKILDTKTALNENYEKMIAPLSAAKPNIGIEASQKIMDYLKNKGVDTTKEWTGNEAINSDVAKQMVSTANLIKNAQSPLDMWRQRQQFDNAFENIFDDKGPSTKDINQKMDIRKIINSTIESNLKPEDAAFWNKTNSKFHNTMDNIDDIHRVFKVSPEKVFDNATGDVTKIEAFKKLTSPEMVQNEAEIKMAQKAYDTNGNFNPYAVKKQLDTWGPERAQSLLGDKYDLYNNFSDIVGKANPKQFRPNALKDIAYMGGGAAMGNTISHLIHYAGLPPEMGQLLGAAAGKGLELGQQLQSANTIGQKLGLIPYTPYGALAAGAITNEESRK